MPSTRPAPSGGNARLLAVLLAPVFMALIAVSVINVALPAIEGSLHATSSGLQWVLSGYALAFGVMLVPAGRLGDATGRRRMLLIGVAVFTLGALLCGMAPNTPVLNLARILQGLGSGLLNPQTVGIIQRYFRGQDRAKAFAALGTTVAVATAVGPVIGGLLIEWFGAGIGWRSMFLINVPIGLATILLGRRWIPDDRKRGDERPDLDPVGAVLLTAAVLAMMVPFLERGAGPLVWLGMPMAAGVLVVWVRWETAYKRRGRPPMVDLAILASPAFRNGMMVVGVYFLGFTSVWIIVPLYVQMHLHHTALGSSLLGLPSSFGAAVSAQLSGRHVLRLGRRLVSAGCAVMLIGLAATAALAPGVEAGRFAFWVLAAPLTLVGVSQGMTIAPNQTLTLNAVDPRFGGVAGGVLQLGQRLGTAMGTALITGVLFSVTEAGGSWVGAFVIALLIIAATVAVALAVSIVDRVRERREAAAHPG